MSIFAARINSSREVIDFPFDEADNSPLSSLISTESASEDDEGALSGEDEAELSRVLREMIGATGLGRFDGPIRDS
jgi:hypothetical protein